MRASRVQPLKDSHCDYGTEADPKNIYIFTSISAHSTAFRVDSLLARQFVLAGHRVTMLLCDGVLEACQDCEYRFFPSDKAFISYGPSKTNCTTCKVPDHDRIPGVSYEYYSTYLVDRHNIDVLSMCIDEILNFNYEGIHLGDHIKSGALRFLAKGQFDLASSFDKGVIYRYAQAAFKTFSMIAGLTSQQDIDLAIIHHGIYIPQGIIENYLKAKDIPFYTWCLGYKNKTLNFSRNMTYHKYYPSPMNGWDSFSFSKKSREDIISYLKSRSIGSKDWISWNRNSESISKSRSLIEFLNDSSTPIYSLFTNVFWDAQIHFKESIFDDMLSWIVYTIKYFIMNPQLRLIIRIHPAEKTGALPSRQLISDEIAKAYPFLPDNVFIVAPNSPTNSYELASVSRVSLVYGTKLGIELPALGYPVITTGDCWAKGKGFTFDPGSQLDYVSLLDQFQEVSLYFDRERALKFAYYIFYKRMIPVQSLTQGSGFAPIQLSSDCNDDPYLELITHQILSGQEVVRE